MTAAFEPRHGDVRTRRALQHADPATRRALSHLLADHRHRRLDGDTGPTAETLVHRRRGNHTDTIEALVCSRKLGWSEQAAALQIAAVYEALTAALWTRGCRWEQRRVEGGGSIPMRLPDLYQRFFFPWVLWMTAPGSLFQACERCGVQQLVPYRIDVSDCGSRRPVAGTTAPAVVEVECSPSAAGAGSRRPARLLVEIPAGG